MIATVSVAIFLFLFCGSLVVSGANTQTVLITAGKSGSIFTAIGFFWMYFNRRGWKQGLFRYAGWLSSVPDLSGRWEGIVCRHKDDEPHPFVLEITQTFSNISYRTFSRSSKGESITASIFTDENESVYTVYSIWRTSTRKTVDLTEEDYFYGASMWNVSFEGEKKFIEDSYFTGREPQTKGSLRLEWKSNHLLNRFS